MSAAAPLHVPFDLLERGSELSLLEQYLEGVRETRRGRTVVVAGEAGVGKTSLVRCFCADHDARVTILAGNCEALFAPRSLGPVLDIADAVGGELRDALKGGAQLHDIVTALLNEVRRRAPAVLVIEDLHWADEATLDVLRLMIRKVEDVPVLILVTHRDDQLERTHPLRRALGEFATDGSVRRMKLVPLSPDAVAELAASHGVDAGELYRMTAGNPFFVVEALASGMDGIPTTVRDAVLARAARLSPTANVVLDAAALTPPHAELWLLEALVGSLDGLEECLTSGMLRVGPAGIEFRHELARLALEGSVAPNRARELHRRALAALADPPAGTADLARLAHHAAAAGDGEAVLKYGPAAGELAASLGAHREAAAQYARVVRHAGHLAPGERAELFERQAASCYLTDQYDEGIAALEHALELRRLEGDQVREGEVLTKLSTFLWCPGHVEESRHAGHDAVSLLETQPPGRERAQAYLNLAFLSAVDDHSDDAVAWAKKALAQAERLGDEELVVVARMRIVLNEPGDQGLRRLEQVVEQAAPFPKAVADGYNDLTWKALALGRSRDAAAYAAAGIDFCADRGYELTRLYILSARAWLELERGHWDAAAQDAGTILGIHRTSISPRISALCVLALVRARRGDPGWSELLDEAWRLAEPTGEVYRVGPVAAAWAETSWLAGDRQGVAAATERVLDQALALGTEPLLGQLAAWRLLAGLDAHVSPHASEAHRLQATGEWAAAANLWVELDCPYQAALAFGQTGDEESLRRSLELLQGLDARPAAAIVARRLREQGARGLPRGPRPATRTNPYGLTVRELEVLGLLAGGLRNSDIASRLVVSERTVDHHVAAVLRKLGVHTRAEAAAESTRLGLTSDSDSV
ncbi:MAG: hypothetical protein QOE43_963 [Gaiellaceae bacterium]|nr:hypothetical protein [Gaiellaceae bacterium]